VRPWCWRRCGTVSRLRYIDGERDVRGMVVPGTEVVGEFRTAQVSARRRLEEAAAFFRRGNFAAVRELLPDPASPLAAVWPADVLARAGCLRPLAEFYAAWDRFDYPTAASVSLPAAAPAEWVSLLPSVETRAWVTDLARPLPAGNADRAEHLRRLTAELLANGERRLREKQYEEALLRAYRLLELLGEARLFARNVDPIARRMNRHQVLDELERLHDPLAADLKARAQTGAIRATDRHESILTHGYQSVAGGAVPLQELYASLEKLLVRDGGAAAEQRLRRARSVPFSTQAGTPLAVLVPV
jgi:hypothetical protein